MISEAVLQAFLLTGYQEIKPLQAGLINNSYCVSLHNKSQFFLQKINTNIFKEPAVLQQNYNCIQQHLFYRGAFHLPKIIPAHNRLLFTENNEVWRCFEYLQNTYSPAVAGTVEKAYEVANCFGIFTAQLHSLSIKSVQTVLPYFHDLEMRYAQMETAILNSPNALLAQQRATINNIKSYDFLVKWYSRISKNKKAYPLHIMHQDCKISNILFDKTTDKIITPVDIDTTQPGLFFSDLGDMLRSMVANLPEDAANVNELEIRTDYYDAIVQGYADAMQNLLTPDELIDMHYAGLALTYMQAIRFFTDYLNGNVYYKVAYPEQNKDRTANQLRLLFLLKQYTDTLGKS